jgi:hypothetical protein
VAVLVAATTAAATQPVAPAGAERGRGRLEVSVLSSSPDQVSGGDTLVEVRLPVRTGLDQLRVDVDGRDVTDAFADPENDGTAVGVVDGLADGENTLRATVERGRGRAPAQTRAVTLVNHPVGGPMFREEI